MLGDAGGGRGGGRVWEENGNEMGTDRVLGLLIKSMHINYLALEWYDKVTS